MMRACRSTIRSLAVASVAWVGCTSSAGFAQPADEAAAQAQTTPSDTAERADLTTVNGLVRAGSYAVAETTLAELQAQYPDDTRILFLRGELLLALGRPAEALPLLQRCVELEPERPRLQFQLGTALQATGDRAGAIAAFGREIERTQDAQVKVLAHLNRSLLYEQDKSWEAAAAELEAALALEPSRAEAWGDLATLYLEAGRLADASRSLEAGSTAGFRSAGHYYSLGTRYLKDEAFEFAVDAFRKVLEIDPQYAEAARNLGVALDRLGRGAEAVPQFQRYLELRPDAPDAAQIRQRLGQNTGG